MPDFKGEQATYYDERITRLVPGYELLHGLAGAQLQVLFPDEASILVVGAGTGKEIIELARLNPNWSFIAQDISEDMLAIADQNFTNLGLKDRVQIHCGELSSLTTSVDCALCLLVLHFLEDNGDKKILLNQVNRVLKLQAPLLIADLMKPETQFEREAQLVFCRTLGLTEVGQTRMRHNLAHEFFPLDRMRFSELLDECGFTTPHLFFKALGFTGVSCNKSALLL
ncbi:MAG: SAM-dependent methyltransferase [Pseudoalteromonas sp.]|uniref:class I SAM-dependent methyltransferase n=1 Tax=Pseudoalteromonas phenolica TaxID=161398 RepID=UPI000C098DF4|nr:SAM-dependent methyltransferase [Pseudoalteromonas sp.]|tara:strand:+ start:2157 stop:2834 length:678 start_codon:yes stop_codon:yes gene_type:complete